MLNHGGLLAHVTVAAVLLAFVLIFTERDGFAWTLAAAVFGGGVVADLAGQVIRGRRSRR
ncbi:hypothetical protein AFL01nite_29980 [Aeromicrobium flavum]|uniref:Uncharacterized protein n=1 Tax=Aeromicrobium flavum TaxID=416568 RepID=A0A512HYZ4_9ACTN|nr:hypothetical protein AFL01nite_29980 [Aeromicrobium flavum]